MKSTLSILIILFAHQVLSQTNELEKYNLDIIDSCISKIDTSIKIVAFHTSNGNAPLFERKMVDSIAALKHFEFSPFYLLTEDSVYSEKPRGVRISIFYESTSCMLQSGYFITDLLTGEKTFITTGDDYSYCWTFKPLQPITTCSH